MLIEKCGLAQSALQGKTILLTGGGGGIGLETARALVWLGANVIIAEINAEKGKAAAQAANHDTGSDRAESYVIDLADETQIQTLVRYAQQKYGFVDAVVNNAAYVAVGAVEDVAASVWDKSYAVNFRAPLQLAQLLLPEMKAKNSGVILFVSSSGAAPYMGAYEVFKTSQVELSNTLAAELEDTKVHALTIGPGLVKTETAMNGIEKIAELMGMSTEAFYQMNEKHMLSAEEAGTGFALAVVFAEKYRGQEISSIQALSDAGLYSCNAGETEKKETSASEGAELATLVPQAADTYNEQYEGWLQRNLFERQWVLRDFKKYSGHSAEQFKARIEDARKLAEHYDFACLAAFQGDFMKLAEYYRHQYKLLQGFEKDPKKLKENLAIIEGWIDVAERIVGLL